MNEEQLAKITAELKTLTAAANEAYLAFFAATMNAPQTPEFNRLREVNNNLRQAIVNAKNQITVS
jgi:hypothetical protein